MSLPAPEPASPSAPVNCLPLRPGLRHAILAAACLIAVLAGALGWLARNGQDDTRLLLAATSSDPTALVPAARQWLSRHHDPALAKALADLGEAAQTAAQPTLVAAAHAAVSRRQGVWTGAATVPGAMLLAALAAAGALLLGWLSLPLRPRGPAAAPTRAAAPTPDLVGERPAASVAPELPAAPATEPSPPVSPPSGLRLALSQGAVQLAYRPVVRLSQGGVVGVEAWPVWLDPEHGEVSGGALVALAEATGQGEAFAHWLLRSCCRDLAAWDAVLGRSAPVTVRISVSASRVLDAGWASVLRAALQAQGLDPGRLMLGVDSALVNAADGPQRLKALSAIGVGLVLDGLGRGAATLGSLQRLPVQAVVIDADWVARALPGTPGRLVVEGAARVAAERGLQVIADGLDSPERAAELAALGASLGQGPAVGGPLSADAMARRLGWSGQTAGSDLRGAPDPVA